MKSIHVRALNDHIFVRRLTLDEEKIGGIVIPDMAKEKSLQGEVLAVGKGAHNEKGERVPPSVRPGDRVVFGKFSGSTITLENEEIMVMREGELLAVLE